MTAIHARAVRRSARLLPEDWGLEISSKSNADPPSPWGGRRALLVTAPHCQPPHGSEHRPWGTTHVREDGATLTACGLSTIGWVVFWNEAFDAEAPSACASCARA